MQEEKRKTLLVIDAANMYMRCVHVIDSEIVNDAFMREYKTLLLQMFKKTISTFNADRVIVCKEGFHNWRKEYYPEYKANRAITRAQSAIDWELFYNENNKFIDDFEQIAQNIQFLQVPNCEADDLIATIVKTQQDYDVIVQSTDKDFYQLFKYSNYKQYDAKNKTYIQVMNPETYLTEKIIMGDSGDNVPRISGVRKGQGPVFVRKNILPDVEKWLKENHMQKEWERNYTLISFDAIPEKYTSAIADKVNSWQKGVFQGRELWNFLTKHKLMNLMDYMTEFVNVFSR